MKILSITAVILLSLCGTMTAKETGNKDMENLTLTKEWDKTFPKSDKVDHSKVTFTNRYGFNPTVLLFLLGLRFYLCIGSLSN